MTGGRDRVSSRRDGRRITTRAAIAMACVALCAAESTSADLPRVRLVATGGTISVRAGGRLSAQELVESIPGLDRYVRAEAEQFANESSSALTLEQWLNLARRLNNLLTADPELAGVVVTSGTDTLEELAYFLHLTVRHDRPVAVVGAMRNAATIGYEGAANLLAGFRVASDPASQGKGVLVVLNDEINSAREVTKTDALRLHTFQSRSYGPLGVVDRDRVVYYRAPLRRHTARSEFDVVGITELPRVDVIMVYQGASGDLIKAAADQGVQGIVIAAAGAGAMSGTQGDGIRYAVEKGVSVVVTTRTGGGRIAARPPQAPRPPGEGPAAPGATRPPSRSDWGMVAGEDLAPVKARLLLMLALTKTRARDEIQRMFLEY